MGFLTFTVYKFDLKITCGLRRSVLIDLNFNPLEQQMYQEALQKCSRQFLFGFHHGIYIC